MAWKEMDYYKRAPGQALTHRGGKRAEEQVGSSHCQTTILTSSIANKEMEQKQVTDGK